MKIFDKRFNALAHLHGEGEDGVTPTELCREIVSKLPAEGFRDLNSTFCDPHCGKGTFLLAIAERCFKEMANVIPDEKQRINHIIQTKLYGYDINASQVSTTATTLKMLLRAFEVEASLNLQQKDSFTLSDIQFNYVVGGPPFKELADNGRQTNKSIWKDFLFKASELTKDKGAFALITPNGWGAPSDNKKLIDNLFTRHNLVYANISTVKRHFPGIASSFGYTITIKEVYNHNTVLLCEDGTHTVDLAITKFVVSKGMSIIKKLTLSKDERCNFKLGGKDVEYPGEGYHYDDKPGTAIYKNIHSVNSSKDYEPNTTIPVRYSEKPSPIQKRKKVVIPYTGPANVIIDNGEYGVGWSQVLLLDNSIDINNVKSVFNSKLFMFFVSFKHSAYNENKNLNQFPLLDLTQAWTDKKMYEYFNLTSKEIEYIEKVVD